MNASTQEEQISVAAGHVDDACSMDVVCQTLAAIHGADYHFGVARWQGQTQLTAPRGRRRFFFVMEAQAAHILLTPGQRVRGIPPKGSYLRIEEPWATVTATMREELWPGDVLCVDNSQCRHVTVEGQVVAFEVEAESTAYPAPTVAFLRYLSDHPGGCAAYPGAFRREAFPPVRAGAGEADQRGVNRVNEHTLDMRSDRNPGPQPHHHGPVTIGAGGAVNHSETALVLPRSCYGLPPVQGQTPGQPEDSENGRVRIYRRPTVDPLDTQCIDVRPGSVIVTPATTSAIAGHCFENAFAMLVAIPGFVSPHVSIKS